MSVRHGQGLFFRYLLAGVSNTLLMAAAILTLTALHANHCFANACGYLPGIIACFLPNARYTFAQTASRHRFGKFLPPVCHLLPAQPRRDAAPACSATARLVSASSAA